MMRLFGFELLFFQNTQEPFHPQRQRQTENACCRRAVVSLAEEFLNFWKPVPYRELLRVSTHCSVILLDKVPCNLVFGNIFGTGRLWSGGRSNICVVIDQVLLVTMAMDASVGTVDGNGSSLSCHIEFRERWWDG